MNDKIIGAAITRLNRALSKANSDRYTEAFQKTMTNIAITIDRNMKMANISVPNATSGAAAELESPSFDDKLLP